MDRRELARAYYEAIDAGDYECLRGLLTDGFRQDRGDQTFESADAFVGFMRDERPETDTTHVVETLYEARDGVAVEGELRRADGSTWFRFVDAFAFEGERLASLATYTLATD